MILCDHHIEKAIQKRDFIIDPLPEPSQFSPSALDLRVGEDFLLWNEGLSEIDAAVDLDRVDTIKLLPLTIPLRPKDGVIHIRPRSFVLVRTLEHIELPSASKLAARVEGKSSQARLGMGVHITAPTIHIGFWGKITLEIINHGPFTLKVRPNQSRLCQLILEKVSGIPTRSVGRYAQQATPLGTPPMQES